MPLLKITLVISFFFHLVVAIPDLTLSVIVNFSEAKSKIPPSSSLALEPELPRVFIDTTYTPNFGRTIRVDQGDDLQAAINNARPGDTIALSPGARFTGNFILPYKTGDGWIIIRPAVSDSLLPQPGERITPLYAPVLPKIFSPNADAAIETLSGAHHYRLIGLELGVPENVTINYGIVKLGNGSRLQNTYEFVPHDFVIDRCYIHGNATGTISRGVALNSARTAVIDSFITECHEVGADTQAICGWNGPGPFKIVNNYLEGAGENFMLGGADASIYGLVSEDVEFRRNHCYKPLRWKPDDPGYEKIHWGVKNLFELKNARRVLIEGNIFENNWVDGQNGFAILFTPRNEEGNSPWSVVEDITFINNIVRHSKSAVNILGRDNLHPSGQTKRIKIKNNLFEDVGADRWGAGGGTFLQLTDTPDVVAENNTVMQTGNVITVYGTPSPSFVFSNNIMPHNFYGVIGDGSGTGNISLNKYFTSLTFTKNVLIGGNVANYPSNNFFPVSINDVGFVAYAQGIYRLSATSQYRNAGTDGKDIGCDFYALDIATRKVAAMGVRTLPR